MESIWHATAAPPKFPQQNGDMNTEVLIIGGGITGILCAYYLQKAGVDYLLVEGKNICQGVTGNTTAKITLQHSLCYADMIEKRGFEAAEKYYKANLDALKQFRELAKKTNCNFKENSSFVYTLTNTDAIKKEYEALKRLGADTALHESLSLPLPITGAVEVKKQAQYHPLKFLYALAKDLNILENTFVRSVKGDTVTTNCGTIKANKIIVATHFPFINSHGLYFAKLYQHRSYVIALENAPNVDGMYVDEAQNGLSFRNWDKYLFIGGGDHKTGAKGGNWKELRDFALEHYPKARERFSWATQDCMSLDGTPYIGAYSSNTPNLLVATGFNKWGMTSSMVAAKALTERITTGSQEPFSVFSPQRSMLNLQLAKNGLSAVGGLLTPTPKRCPHMGCALKWNAADHSWDCPCHGSRFSEGGDLLNNPAMKKLK